MLASLQRSIQVELDQFFACIALTKSRPISNDAFRMARKKLKPSVFVELNNTLQSDVPPGASRWHGWRVVAADSTTLYLPTSHVQTIAPEHFNHYHDGTGGIYSLARGAALLDVASGLFLRADIDSDSRGERMMLLDQLDALKSDDLLILDRGYPAHWLFALLLARQQEFCMRLSADYCPQVREFVRSGQASAVVSLRPGHAHREQFERHHLSMAPFAIRLVRVVLPSGQIHILATSLLDEAAYPAREFAKLYRQRWQIEEAFRHIKCRLKLEQFGGETPLAIRQEFHASILLHNLATLAGLDALSTLDEDESHIWHVNLTHASHLLRINLSRLLRHPDEAYPCCAQIIAAIIRSLTRKRPDRAAPPRKPNHAKPRYHRAYK